MNLFLMAVSTVIYFGSGGKEKYLTAGQYSFPIQSYMMIAYTLFILICFMIPGISGACVSTEREKHTLDFLLTTYLSPGKIIRGKLEACLGVTFFISFSALPILSLIMIFGGISILDLFCLVLILIVSSIFITSIGIFCSTVLKKMVTSVSVSYGIIFMLTVGTVLFLFGVYYFVGSRMVEMEMIAEPNVGAWIYLLYVNPMVVYYGLLSQQVGTGFELRQICNHFGIYENSFGITHMLEISIGIQLTISVILLYLATRYIDSQKNDV